MATTCQTLIEAAYARSTANDPGDLSADPELIGVIDRRLKAIYSFAARVNKYYFAKSVPVVGSSGSWAFPSDSESVFYVESTVPAEVHIVPFKDRLSALAPRVYKYGQALKTVGQAGDPANNATLTLFYSYQHPALNPALSASHATNTLEANWPEEFNDLVVFRLCRYLATKDGVREDLGPIVDEEKELTKVFIRHLQNYNNGVKGRFAHDLELISISDTLIGSPE
jgi:hypothetical protein